MAKPFGVWGIDVGQVALKAMRLEMIDGVPTATAFDYIEHPKILSQPDADPEALTREALEKFFERNPLGKDEVAIGVPGQSGLARFVKLPPVEEKKVADIVKFEAKQQIPFPLDEVVWDYQKIAGGETVGGFAMETEVGLFAMKRDIINRYLGQFKAVNAEVNIVQMTPLALCNFATYELLKKGGPGEMAADDPAAQGDTPKGKKRCAVILDIGTDSSTLIITDGGKIIWQRPIPLGGNHFTRALTKELKLTYAKAEHLKRNAAKSPDLAQILRGLRPVLTEFVGEVQRSLGYFTNTHRDAHVAYLVGLGNAFRLPGLQKYLSEKLSLTVNKPNEFERITGDQVLDDPSFKENILTFPVAYGLALQGLDLARLKTNLLPEDVRTERLIKAKKPAVAMAAAALLFGVMIMGLGYGMKLSAATDPQIASAEKTAESAVSASQARDSERSAKLAEVEENKEQVKAIVVGNDERLNWIRFQEVLNAALPRHGNAETGGNLDAKGQDYFWTLGGPTGTAQQAYEKYKKRIGEGIPLDQFLYDEDLAQYLAQVNVEAVYGEYTSDLNGFLQAADKYVKTAFNDNVAEKMAPSDTQKDEESGRLVPKPIEGGGWVIEIRGYTEHESGLRFLNGALLKNLQRFDEFAQLTKKADGTENKMEELLPGTKDPVDGTVSHAMLLLRQDDENPQQGQFKYINNSIIRGLIPRAGGGAGEFGAPPGDMGRGPGGPPMDMGSSDGGEYGDETGLATGGESLNPPWTPISPVSTIAGVSGVGGGDAFGEGGMPGGPMMSGGPGGPPAGIGGFGGGSSDASPGGPFSSPGTTPGIAPSGQLAKVKKRYEFVAVIIWREPTPTDFTPAADGEETIEEE